MIEPTNIISQSEIQDVKNKDDFSSAKIFITYSGKMDKESLLDYINKIAKYRSTTVDKYFIAYFCYREPDLIYTHLYMRLSKPFNKKECEPFTIKGCPIDINVDYSDKSLIEIILFLYLNDLEYHSNLDFVNPLLDLNAN